MKLDHISAGVLYLLWHRSCNGDAATLVPAKVLQKELVGGKAGSYRTDLNIVAVKHALRQLRNAGIVDYGESTKDLPARGPAPEGYRLSVDPQIVTWPASAAIIMFVHKKRRASRNAVIEEAIRCELTHHNTNKPLKREDVPPLIDWCIRKEYFKEQEMPVDDGVSTKKVMLLVTTGKVDQYGTFLEKLFSIKPSIADPAVIPEVDLSKQG